jgi:hypothetical protein
MKHINTRIDINAPIAMVWTVLTDFDNYPEWNPVEISMKGKPVEGSVLEHTAQLPGRKPVTFRPLITSARKGEHLAWKGKFWLPGLFDVLHEFRLEELPDQRARVHQDEHFRGVLLPLLGGAIHETEKAIQLTNQALKARAEALAGGTSRRRLKRPEGRR